ncbi:MAG: tRNA 2-thiouridine(34) synthase MnmA [bacterium]
MTNQQYSKTLTGQKVFVGLSGGVDSSVSALLLKKAGFDVTGVFIKVWQPENGDCTWKEDRRDAMRVAANLGIKFITLDLRDEYKHGVVDYMIDEYAKGRTPNPDVMCNKEVKFGAFMNFALANGADFVATGHYAQTAGGEMFEGRDGEKDQSYFLWTLKGEQLNKILFPIGHLEKAEVRKIAEKNNIPVARKKDSQGVCFIGHIDMKDFIREHILANTSGNISDAKNQKGLAVGDVLDTSGNVIGKHDGSLFYTIGERHGLALSTNSTNTPRYYVIDKDIEKNTITVAEKEQMKKDGAGAVEKLVFDDIHFIQEGYRQQLVALVKRGDDQITQSGKIDEKTVNFTNQGEKTGDKIGGRGINCLARARYRQKKEPCTLSYNNGKYEIVFARPQDGITPGQSLVLYFANSSDGAPADLAKNVNKANKIVDAKTLGGVII